MKIVLSGKMNMVRTKESKRFMEMGISVQSNVAKNTDVLVIGEDPGWSKMDKAKRYNIKILKETEFFDLLLIENPEFLI